VSGMDPHNNKLLAALPREDYERLVRQSSVISLHQGTVLCEADDEVSQVYFPLSGMISLVIMMKTGKAIETATVGREGAVGAMAGLGIHVSAVRAIVQVSLSACRLPAPAYRRLTAASPAIANLAVLYNEVLLSQARITAACNALHPVERRFSRWLLQTNDRAAGDTITNAGVPISDAGRPPHLRDRSCR
jgi:CRP-like cAMP-binding protein